MSSTNATPLADVQHTFAPDKHGEGGVTMRGIVGETEQADGRERSLGLVDTIVHVLIGSRAAPALQFRNNAAISAIDRSNNRARLVK